MAITLKKMVSFNIPLTSIVSLNTEKKELTLEYLVEEVTPITLPSGTVINSTNNKEVDITVSVPDNAQWDSLMTALSDNATNDTAVLSATEIQVDKDSSSRIYATNIGVGANAVLLAVS